MPENTQQEFKRRKFTITEGLDDELGDLADDHYQGNVSLCLRQAIADHKATLNGEGRLTLKRLNQNVREVEELLVDIAQTVGSLSEEVDEFAQQNSSSASITPSAESEWEKTAQIVFSVLDEANGPLRFEDIVERGGLKPMAAMKGLGRLKDVGYVFQSSDNPPRFYIAQMSRGSSEGFEE